MLAIYRKRLRRQTPAIMYPEGVGGREVCSPTAAGRKEYKIRTQDLINRQRHKCAICQHLQMGMEFDHEAGRGANGKHRDDRIFHRDGSWRNSALCSICNSWKSSRRFRWIEGKYQEVVRQQFKEIA